MKQALLTWVVAGMVALSIGVADAEAQASKAKPVGATAECKDGSYSTAKTQRGACSGHGGIATWLATTKDATKTTAAKGTGQTSRTEAKSSDIPGTAVATSAGKVPANVTGQCKDATYTTASSKRGACSGHGGVATWLADTTGGKASPQTQSAAAHGPSPAPAASAPTAPSTTGAATQAPPADAPQNATAQCNDGTYSLAKQHRGACSSHKGVKTWFK